MKTFSSGFSAEIANKRGSKPLWIFRLTAGSADYYISDVPTTITGWQASPVTTLPWVAQWGEITEQVSGSLNEIRIADFSLSLIADPDDADNIDHLITAHTLEASPCSLFLWFLGLDPATDPPQEFYRGYVRDLATSDGGMTWNITVEDESSRLTGNYGEVLTQETYPNCLPDHVGRVLPVVFGTATNIKPPCAKSLSNINYYLFGCTLDSVGTVLYADGTAPTGLSTTLSHGSFGGRTVIQCNATTPSAVMGTQTITVEPYIFYIDGISFTTGQNEFIDGSDSTYRFGYIGYGSLSVNPVFAFSSPQAVIAVQARLKLKFGTYPATVTMTLRNPAGTTVGSPVTFSVTSANVSTETWLDTGWITSSYAAGSAWTITLTGSIINIGTYIYGAHLNIQYAAQTGTTYTAAPTDIVVLAAERSIAQDSSIIIWRPTYADTAPTAVITNEPNQRDGNLSTYSTWADTGSLNKYVNYQDATINVWPNVSSSRLPYKMRAGVKYSITTSAYLTLMCKTYQSLSPVVSDTSSIMSWGNKSAATVYSDWVRVHDGVVLFTLQLVASLGSTGISIYDTWIEFDTSSAIDTPDSASTTILGDTVTGTWPSLPASYQVNGAIIESKRIIDWLDYLAFQNRCWFRISCGAARLIWRPDTLTAVATINAVRSESGRPMWARKRAPKTDVVNAIALKYNRDYSQSGDTSYGKISSATDATSIAEFGQLSRDELFKFDFVTQDQQAQLVRDFYLNALKNRYWLEELTVFLDHIALEFGDAVTLPDGRVGIIVSMGIQPGSIDAMDSIKITVMA